MSFFVREISKNKYCELSNIFMIASIEFRACFLWHTLSSFYDRGILNTVQYLANAFYEPSEMWTDDSSKVIAVIIFKTKMCWILLDRDLCKMEWHLHLVWCLRYSENGTQATDIHSHTLANSFDKSLLQALQAILFLDFCLWENGEWVILCLWSLWLCSML